MVVNMKTKVPSTQSDDRAATEAQDLQKINAAVDRLNAEAEDVMEYQSGTRTTDGTQG
jgi:hypothetical protein